MTIEWPKEAFVAEVDGKLRQAGAPCLCCSDFFVVTRREGGGMELAIYQEDSRTFPIRKVDIPKEDVEKLAAFFAGKAPEGMQVCDPQFEDDV